MSTLLLALHAALAAPVGHYHPADVSEASAQFARAQAAVGATFQDRSERAEALAAALRQFEEALDLLGARAPADQRARHEAQTRAYHRAHAVLSGFASAQVDAFDAAFRTALDKAIAGREVEECRSAAGGGVRITPRFGGGPPRACAGADLNAELAARMDADPALAAAIDRVVAEPWPELTLEIAAVSPIGAEDAAAVVPVRAWVARAAPDALASITAADEEARETFQAAIEEGASTDALREMRDAARALTATTAQQRADLAAGLLSATEAVAARKAKAGGPTLAWCAQPALLGGCTLPEADAAVLGALADHPKVRAAAARAASWRP